MANYNVYGGRALSITIGTILVFLVLMGSGGVVSDAAVSDNSLDNYLNITSSNSNFPGQLPGRPLHTPDPQRAEQFSTLAIAENMPAQTAATGDVNITKIGHFGGSIYAVEVSGNYAYTGKGSDFVVLNISNKTTPSEVGRLETSGIILDITLAGNYAYVADDNNGLVIVDVTNPAAPTLIGTYKTAWYSLMGVAVAGNYAYGADWNNGLVIINVTNPAAPFLEGRYDTIGLSRGVAVAGNYAYVVDDSNGLVIVDVTNPAAPTLKGSYDTAGDSYGVAVAGNYAYVADNSNGLVIVNVTNPAAPTLKGSYNTNGYSRGVEVVGTYAYVADYYGLVIVNVTNPADPTLKGSYDTAGASYGVTLAGNYAYVADDSNGLVIVDVTNPAVPTLKGSYDTAGNSRGVAVAGDYAYVAEGSNGLVIVDVTNPAVPTLKGSYDTAGYSYGVTLAGDYAYVADGPNGLVIVDVSNPAAPTLIGTYNLAWGGSYSMGVAVVGNYAYVADDYNGLLVVDVTNPAVPTLIGNFDTAGNSWGVAVAGDYAYVADYSNGLVIVDVTNPAVPTLIGNFETAGNSWGVAVAGNYAYMADSWYVEIFDVSDPAASTLIGSYSGGVSQGVTVEGNYAYVADAYRGLLIVDVSDPATPTLISSYDTAVDSYGVAVAGDYAYVADGENGLGIFRIDTKISLQLGEAVDNTELNWSTEGNSRWYLQTTNCYFGGDCAQSGDIDDSQNTWIQAAVTGPGTLTFYWKVSSENNYDFLKFYIDSIEQTGVSGSIDWQKETYNIGSGTHTIQWKYEKDGSDTTLPDAGWIDKVEFIPTTETNGKVHNVNKGFNYTTIQAAINAASPGDEIHVDSGTYYENVYVDRQLTLRGIGMPVVNAGGSGSAITLAADGIRLEGFTATGGGDSGIEITSNNNRLIGNTANLNNGYCGDYDYENDYCNYYVNGFGIYLESSDNNLLSGNNVSNNQYGIKLWSSSNNTLSGNNVSSSNSIGIHLGSFTNSSNNNTLNSNNVSNNLYGIILWQSSKIVLMNNILTGNNYNLELGGNSDSFFDNQIDTTNLVDGKSVYYIKSAKDMVYDSYTNAGTFYCISCVNVTLQNLDLTIKTYHGVFFWNTTRSKIQNVTASNTVQGIVLDSSSNNTLIGNNANSNNWYGISLSSSSNNMLIGNNASNNSNGISLSSSSNNTLSDNNVESNNWIGIGLLSSNNNNIYHNNLMDNTNQAQDNTNTNSWDNGYPSGGNYWSDYSGSDTMSGSNQDQPGSDGIGDTPYPIAGGSSVDKYPLIAPSTPGTPVESITGEGTVYFDTGAGIIQELTAVNPADIPETPPPEANLNYGLFRFNITGITPGGSVTLTLTFPEILPAGTTYWKYGANAANDTPHWYTIPSTINGNTITITLVDGGEGDDDMATNGMIKDDGGPSLPANEINIAPVADCGNDKLGCENTGTKVQFNGTASYDPDGTIRSYDWEFGDGGIGTDASPNHTYASYRWNGTAYDPYTVNLTVTDNSGLTNMTSLFITVRIAGDANDDGKVDILDASVVGRKWGTNDPCADLNKDGAVNILDASIIGLNWGKLAIIGS